MGRQLIDDAFLKEWCHNSFNSTASSGGEEDSSDPHVPTSGSEEEVDAPECQEGPGGWLEGPRDAPDGFVHTCHAGSAGAKIAALP